MKPHHKPVIPISSGEGEPADASPERPEGQRVDEHSALLLGTLANLQFQQRDYDAAADSYRKILQVDPGDYSARLNLGICLEKTGQWAAALEEFGRVLEVDPHRDGQ